MIDRIQKSRLLARAVEQLKPGGVVSLSGVWGSAAPFLAALTARTKGWPLVFLCAHLDDADDAADDIETLTGQSTTLFPAWEADARAEHVSDEIAAQRLRICTLLSTPMNRRDESLGILIAPVMALLQPVPSLDTLRKSRLHLTVGGQLSPEGLADWLVGGGFEPSEMVDQLGQFARRGGIVDVLPVGATEAIRVEFFGDEIDSIRRFDLDTQRTTEPIDSYELAAISAGREFDPSKTTNLLSYLSPETVFCLADAVEVAELAKTFHDRVSDPTGMYRPESIFAGLKKFAVLETFPFTAASSKALDFGIQSLDRLTAQPAEAMTELAHLSEETAVTVYCENTAEQNRFGELMAQTPGLAERVTTAIGHINHGFQWPSERVALVGHHELFHRYAKRRRLRRVRAGRPIDSFIDLQEGDYVVHVAHGVARFEGLRHLEADGKRDEFLTLRFADNALLHVPTSQISLVQKYIGSVRIRPKLSKLGGAAWARQKERVAEAVRDMAAEMLRIQAVRENTPGIAYPPDTKWQRQFEQEFIYTETEDQLSSIREIKEDLGQPRPMDRLLCGDVGFGKTEMAIRAAFKVVQEGKQVAVLVPTTVLAAQHARTFAERLADYPVNVEVTSRFRTKSQQVDIAKRLALKKIDILIGTHRLLSKDMKFADLGLVVVDEEQRFGVAHKERFKTMRAMVDVLTMTATPIPRTLHMSLLGLRDISNLTTPPLDRRAIHTEVSRYDEHLIRRAIQREIDRHGQVFYLHNRVRSIHKIADKIRSLAPDARVAVGHGQMPAGELEKVMLGFVRQHYDVLVSTTIIESGLDIPTANTIIIDNADRFGLAELHQLRGRVGRYKHRAYCHLLLPENRSVTPVAAKRLKAIEEFSDLGAGFQIAMRDLEIRGAGNILGPEQSGHIAAIGYELYCQLLEEAVGSLRGDKPKPRKGVSVDLGISAYIPRSYIPADRQRMEVYRRIARSNTAAELEQLQADLRDVYGKIPPDLDTVLQLAEVRILAGPLGIDSIVLMKPDIIFSVRDWSRAKNAFKGAAGTVRLPDDKTVHWRLPERYLNPPTMLTVLRKQLNPRTRKVR